METLRPAVSPLTAYAVIATPRSGTELLCDALASTGLAGKPREHLRPFHQMKLRDFNYDSNCYLQHLMSEHHNASQVFGTKLISHFLREHLRSSPQLGTTLSRFRFVRLIREDKVGQAISSMIATKLGRWHVRSSREHAIYASQLDMLEIDITDFAAVRRNEMTLRRDELFLDGFLEVHSVSPLVISYEDLVSDARNTVSRVLDFLDIKYDQPTDISVSLKPTSSRISEIVRSQYNSGGAAKR